MTWTLAFAEVGAADLPRVGGKGANLGELTRAGVPVPPGFCVTTDAYRAFLADDTEWPGLLAEMDALGADDVEATRVVGARVRGHLEARSVPQAIADEVLAAWRKLGESRAYAVRSSATAEDLPDASFAGQQDTYLNIVGADALLDRMRACWASLFTDRAILYRRRNNIDHTEVALSVVVQRMVLPQKAGILFTGDPVSGHRFTTRIDAGFGLGEALVSGLVSADLYTVDVRARRVIDVVIGDKALAIEPIEGGGTVQVDLPPERRHARVLSDDEALRLAEMGARIEKLRGGPQDVEWCVAEGEIYIVQARPITSLYPLPDPMPTDGALHAYVSFNHFQVMTDAMPLLARRVWQLVLPFGRPSGEVGPNPYFVSAGSRLYLDLSPLVRRKWMAKRFTGAVSIADHLIAQGLAQVAERDAFRAGPKVSYLALLRGLGPKLGRALSWLLFRDPTPALNFAGGWLDNRLAEASRAIAAGATTAERLRICRAVLCTEIESLFGTVPPLIFAPMFADKMLRRLLPGHGADIDALGRGLHGNVTTVMDLAVGDLADTARAHPAVVAALRAGRVDRNSLANTEGGPVFLAALDAFLAKYGDRGPSEIDISRKRWRDDPTSVLQAVAGNLSHVEGGTHRQHHAALSEAADAATARLIDAASALRRPIVRRLIRVFRHLMPVREHPKFFLVRLYARVRAVALEAAAELVRRDLLERGDDVWLFDFVTLADALEQGRDLRADAAERRAVFAREQGMTPPRVMTSEGEVPIVRHEGDVPEGALAGSPASAGVVEGIARVVRDPQTEVLNKGEILIAPFTDPGWTPLFLNAAGLVMEVGGLMTHGSVVAREYGIPAVVCVPDATTAIRTGQRVRVDGDRGFVQILDDVENAA
ncbi:MAG: phosphoenolpyruvate synthase [Myxococcales bacterium]|nr:phosphoenolpyruvate synthase [Myxococcales bacterium]